MTQYLMTLLFLAIVGAIIIGTLWYVDERIESFCDEPARARSSWCSK